MTRSNQLWTRAVLGGGLALGLAGCALDAPKEAPREAVTLETLEVAEDFDFATTKRVELVLERSRPSAEPVAVEVADAEGRRLLKGAFLGDAAIGLKVPSGAARTLTVRTGAGDGMVEQAVELGADGRAGASF